MAYTRPMVRPTDPYDRCSPQYHRRGDAERELLRLTRRQRDAAVIGAVLTGVISTLFLGTACLQFEAATGTSLRPPAHLPFGLRPADRGQPREADQHRRLMVELRGSQRRATPAAERTGRTR